MFASKDGGWEGEGEVSADEDEVALGEIDLTCVDVQPVGADAAVVRDTAVSLNTTPSRKAAEGARDLSVEDVHRRLVAGVRGGEFPARGGEPVLVSDLAADLVDLGLIHGGCAAGGESEDEADESEHGVLLG